MIYIKINSITLLTIGLTLKMPMHRAYLRHHHRLSMALRILIQLSSLETQIDVESLSQLETNFWRLHLKNQPMQCNVMVSASSGLQRWHSLPFQLIGQ